ncbi:MAG: hypothetical protein H6883_11620 [Rhodobiaceae bacterium]|nr:hypothetical protein [Rhodobiaceae bacterium]
MAAGCASIISDTRSDLARAGVIEAVQRHDDDVLFAWLMQVSAYQGISDAAAEGYAAEHGHVAAAELREALDQSPACPKLKGYWTFASCRFHKGSRTCTEPELVDSCPLPRHDLRNGRLNQTAYAMYLFMRDVAGGDFVGWIDRRLETAAETSGLADRAHRMRQSLLEPLGHIYGVSDKVLSMALADLLLAADPNRMLWVETGASMIAIDTLVHNWFLRTGVIDAVGKAHPYGTACYGDNGCALAVEKLAKHIDARDFNPTFPEVFPRFVQHAIWRFCAQSGLNRCNGNRVDDAAGCQQADCSVFARCERRPLLPL